MKKKYFIQNFNYKHPINHIKQFIRCGKEYKYPKCCIYWFCFTAFMTNCNSARVNRFLRLKVGDRVYCPICSMKKERKYEEGEVVMIKGNKVKILAYNKSFFGYKYLCIVNFFDKDRSVFCEKYTIYYQKTLDKYNN